MVQPFYLLLAALAGGWAISFILDFRLAAEGLMYSSILALSAVGLTLTYQTTKVPNFAHGAFIGFGILTALALGQKFGVSPYVSGALGAVLAVASSLGLFAALYPLYKKGASPIVLMMASMSYNIIMLGILNAAADYLGRNWGIFTRGYTLKGMDGSIGGLQMLAVAGPMAVLAAAFALYFLLTRTKLGIALRAAVENEELARALGIDVDRAYAVAWALSGALAGYAGALFTLYLSVEPDTGWLILASIFAASIAGGLNNIYGAVLGAFFMGFVEVPLAALLARAITAEPYVLLQYRPLLPLLAVAVFLMVIPQGLITLKRK